MPERLFSALRYLSAPLTGALGGLLASLAGWPLPWMTGSLVAVILLRCSGWQCSPPPGSRQTGQLIVACAIGLHFTTPVFAQIISHLGLIVLGACGTFSSNGNQAVWTHPHPPCSDETSHPGTVTVVIADGQGNTVTQSYGGTLPPG